MRRCNVGLLALTVAMLHLPAAAVGQVFIAGGLTVPTGAFGHEYQPGWMVNAGTGVWGGNDQEVAARIEMLVGVNAHEGDEDARFSVAGVLGSLTWKPAARAAPPVYLIGSAGYLRQHVEVGDVDGNDGGVAIAGGVGLRLRSLQLEGRFLRTSIAGRTTQFVAASAGIVF